MTWDATDLRLSWTAAGDEALDLLLPWYVNGTLGDAEMDEGNIFEALLEGWKHDIRNVWWVIDYNRQSLDRVVPERLFSKIEDFFSAVGWRVVTLKYGKLLQAAFARPGGDALRQWIDDCPNDLYSALTFKGGVGWRERLTRDVGHLEVIRDILAAHDDTALARLMTNLGGHDLDSVRETIARPWNAILLTLFAVSMFWHTRMGLQTIIEDYIHTRSLEIALQFLAIVACTLGALASLYAIARIALL